MTKRLNALWAVVALLLCCAGVASAQTAARRCATVAVRWRSGGLSPSTLTQTLQAFAEDGLTDAPTMTLWARSTGTATNGETTLNASLLQTFGDANQVPGLTLLAGNVPTQGDAYGCVLSPSAAFALFGTTDALGQTLELTLANEPTLPLAVQGICQSDEDLLLYSLHEQSNVALPNLQLGFATAAGRSEAEAFLARANFAGDFVLLDLPLVAWLLQALAWLPGLLLGGLLLGRLLLHLVLLRRAPLHALLFAPVVLLLGGGTLALLAPLGVPAQVLPGQWSDFAHWSDLATTWREALVAWLATPTPEDLALLFAAFGTIALVAGALVAMALGLPQLRGGTRAGLFAHCAVAICLPGLAAWCAGGHLQVPLWLWLLPALWLATRYSLIEWRQRLCATQS